MESLAAVELFQNSTKYNVKFSSYTGDDYSTTASYLREQVPYGVEKYSDIHMKHSLTTRFYNISKSSKFVNCSEIISESS